MSNLYFDGIGRFCAMVDDSEEALRKHRYKKEVIMYWYGVLTEAALHLEILDGEEIPEETWDIYEALCDMAGRIINKL